MSVSTFKWRALLAALLGLGVTACADLAETEVDLPWFHEVNPAFFRGAQPTLNGIQALPKLGIKTVINLRAADEDSGAEEYYARQAGLRYFNFPMEGRGRPAEAEVQAILAVIGARENQPVFVHCKRGKDRTGTIVACYRILHDGWTSEQAIDEARLLGLRWTEFGMKRYIRDLYRSHLRQPRAAGAPATATRRPNPNR